MDKHGKFTIAIVYVSLLNPAPALTVGRSGGGIGGLAFAVALAKTGTDCVVDIYESTESFGEVGAGIGLWPRVWDTMKTLGLEEDLRSKSTSLGQGGKMTYRKCDQAEPVPCGSAPQPMQPFHRAEFLKILENRIPSNYRKNFSKRLVSYEDIAPNPIVLRFKDGTTAECDVLVGADGIKSAVRRAMFVSLAEEQQDSRHAEAYRQCVDAKFSGVVTYRALVQAEALKAEYPDHPALSQPFCYFGKGKFVVSYPVSQGRVVNVAALSCKADLRGTQYEGSWVAQASPDEILANYPDWDPEVRFLLKAMTSPSKWAVNEVRGLPAFVSGRVALLGDAAHAMTPHLASGAGQAVEDGLVLASLLTQPEVQRGSIQRALEVYDEVRRPFAQHIQDLSFQYGDMLRLESPRMMHYTTEDSIAGKISRDELMELLEQDTMDVQRWMWTTTPREDLERAIVKLRATANVSGSTTTM
ncbi:hypothetical protein BC835DRAFT_255975 [Cytidiella melzeri]|nr:hypothetical protein BC835DRAFT_255975 [Cytidiella melzeri]